MIIDWSTNIFKDHRVLPLLRWSWTWPRPQRKYFQPWNQDAAGRTLWTLWDGWTVTVWWHLVRRFWDILASGLVNIARENGRIKMRRMYGFYFIPNVLKHPMPTLMFSSKFSSHSSFIIHYHLLVLPCDIPMISPIICHDHPLTHINPLFWGWSPHQEPPGATFSRFGLGSTGGAQVGDGSKFKPLLGTRDFRRCLVLRI